MAWFKKRSTASAAGSLPGAGGLPGAGALPGVHARIREIGQSLMTSALAHEKGFFSTSFWSDKLMNWAMKDPAFKVQLFRFIDVFPALHGAAEVRETLLDYLSQPGVTLPAGMGAGLAAGGVFQGTMEKTVLAQITGMAQKFIAGENLADALPTLRKDWDRSLAFSVDLLGEACLNRAEAQAYQQRYLEMIEGLPPAVASWPANPLLESDHLGAVPRANVSIKVSSFFAHIDPIDTPGSLDALEAALAPLLDAAGRLGVLVNFDIEHEAIKDLTFDLFERCCEKHDFPAGLAMQAYLRSGPDDAQRIIDWSRRANRDVTVRLVKGAYWDYQVAYSQQMGWPIPVWTSKSQTDACFEHMAGLFIANCPTRLGVGGTRLALGSHNVRSIAATLAAAEARGLPWNAVELQMLRGMADSLKLACVEQNLRVRQYVPIGELVPGMAYLVRRLLENTSNESWLRSGFAKNADLDALLASPDATEDRRWDALLAPEHHALTPPEAGVGDGQLFFNEPLRDFARAAARDAFATAVRNFNMPAAPADVTVEQAKQALATAHGAFDAWRDTDASDRAGMLLRAAALLRDQRDQAAALVLHESGKPWREADADVCEAIDFLEYYARLAPAHMAGGSMGRFIAEANQHWREPHGVAVVISPWNFPLAICTGMTAAALVTGNPAILKPAEQTPRCAQLICDLLWQAGVPRDVLHLTPGAGETVGDALVRDPRTATIAFTGSREVGLAIYAAAGQTPAGQHHLKRVICEMGGKNAIIVDASADLDEAVRAVCASAFGYAGQKCSACSRAIVLDAVYDTFLERLAGAARMLVIGDPAEPATDIGPVIDEAALEKIHHYIALGQAQTRVALAMDVPAGLAERTGRCFAGPHIFADVPPDNPLAQEEIFGPVLAVLRAGTFEQALAIANDIPYKLTGGVLSRRPAHLALARKKFRVGNLYLNRSITGALVGRQPFGGFGLSGGGTKAGGADYLHHFTDPRALTENTLRHGFAPMPDGPQS